jgi:hypothetical protein
LAINGESEGPFSIDEIGSRLRSRRIGASTPACAEGLTEWRPIALWPSLAPAIPAANSSVGPPPPPPPIPNAMPTAATCGGPSEPVLTNPLLPQMANWICIYSIAIAPLIWFGQHMLCCVDGKFADESDSAIILLALGAMDAFKSLVVTIMLFVGGARLRRLRTSGASLIRIAFWIGLVGGAVLIALMVVGVVFTAPSEVGEGAQPPPETVVATLVQTAQLIVGFCEMLFMIFSLIWLTRHLLELPLTPGT